MTETTMVQKNWRRRTRSEETKRKISEAMSGENNPFYGRKHSDETRAKMSESHRGKKRASFSEDHKRRISEAARSRKYTDETRRKMSESHKGSLHSEETKRKISKNNSMKRPEVRDRHKDAVPRGETHHMYGKHHSKEHRHRVSESLRGKNGPMFGKTGKNSPLYGLKRSEDTKRKMSEHNGMKCPEVRAKISGENSPHWRGGISFLPYCHLFNNPLREQYRNAYGRVCVNCGKSEILNGCRLSVHHCDGNKSQGCDDHEWFLVPLCRSCNSKGFERKPEYVFLFWLKDIERKHRRLN